MTFVLDAGGVSHLAGNQSRLRALLRHKLWPPQVPAVVLTETLTGDPRRDFHLNRLLQACSVRDVDEPMARVAARLRGATGRTGTISAVDAVVMAHATEVPEPVVLTSDPRDMRDLAAHTGRHVVIRAV